MRTRQAQQPLQPDPAAIAIAYELCGKPMSLENMLTNPAQRAALMARARRHMKQRLRIDLQKLRANDND